ncbi:MAG: calcium/sodium antiporter [Candidatus Undinarchaeales archaeon]
MNFTVSLLLFAAGLAVLLKGADWATEKASKIASYFGVSNVIIGLSLVALSTSLPELAVSLTAALFGSGGIALGSVVGSNIANIGLVLGLSVIITPILVDKGNIEEATILLILLTVSAMYMLNGISFLEGVFLLLFIFVYLYDLFRYGEKRISNVRPVYNIKKESIFFVLGIVGVILGSNLMVTSAVSIAEVLYISEEVIAATIIAIGTSLPELSVSLTAAKKGFKDMALGNIIGSCMFNIALVLGFSSLLVPITSTKAFLYLQLPFMVGLSALLLLFMKTRWKLSKKEGMVFLAVYIVFLALQFLINF